MVESENRRLPYSRPSNEPYQLPAYFAAMSIRRDMRITLKPRDAQDFERTFQGQYSSCWARFAVGCRNEVFAS
jgi:hypothetical protein